MKHCHRSLVGYRALIHWIAIAAMVATIASEALAASFDCAKARSDAEKLICATPALSAADEELAGIYRRARERMARSGPESEQAQWFKSNAVADWNWRDKNCQDVPCLAGWYRQRKALLLWIASSDDVQYKLAAVINRHRMQRCLGWSDQRVLTTRNDEIKVHSIPIELKVNRDSFVDCFLSDVELVTRVERRDAISSGAGTPVHHQAMVYRPPYDNGFTLRGRPVKIPEAIVVSDTAVTIVPSSGDSGVEDLQHVSGHDYLIQIGMATHSRVYVINSESGEADYLTNGFSVIIEDPERTHVRSRWLQIILQRRWCILDRCCD